MADLAEFDLRPECPKCTGDRWDWRWQRTATPPEMTPFGEPTDDRLVLTCERCRYSFEMKTRDAK